MIDLEHVLTSLRPEYLDIARDLVAGLADDPRVRAVLLTGSVAIGTADTYSDLDVSVVVGDADTVDVLVSELPDKIPDLVHSSVLVRGPVRVFTAITSGWLRVDVLVESAAVATRRVQPPHLLVIDNDRITGQLRVAGRDPQSADSVRLVEEFLRVVGLLDVVVGRQEYFVGAQGVMLLRDYLVDLFYLENDRARGGGHKRLRRDLTPEQAAVLAAQPALVADAASVVEGHFAAAGSFLPRARALLSERGLDWPELFEASTERHLEDLSGAWASSD